MALAPDAGGFQPALYGEGPVAVRVALSACFADPAWDPTAPPLEAAFPILAKLGLLGPPPSRN